jgi:hypothetical protein
MESLWMLAGESRVEWLSQFNERIKTYAEADGTIHGAYGARWANTLYGDSQVASVIDVLDRDPGSRQAVLQMWNSQLDLGVDKKDRPCNTHMYFDLRGGALNMTVLCRSNDMLWGAYGANAVHFSFLQEAMAHALNTNIGVYRQVSNNFHVYTDLPVVKDFLENPPYDAYDRYQEEAYPMPILQGKETFAQLVMDCKKCITNRGSIVMETEFMRTVATPLRDAYLERKAGRDYSGYLALIPACDWKFAFTDWCARREKKQEYSGSVTSAHPDDLARDQDSAGKSIHDWTGGIDFPG